MPDNTNEAVEKAVAEVMRARRGWHSGVRVNTDVPEANQIRDDLLAALPSIESEVTKELVERLNSDEVQLLYEEAVERGWTFANFIQDPRILAALSDQPQGGDADDREGALRVPTGPPASDARRHVAKGTSGSPGVPLEVSISPEQLRAQDTAWQIARAVFPRWSSFNTKGKQRRANRVRRALADAGLLQPPQPPVSGEASLAHLLEVTEDPERNERRYRCSACDSKFMVPLDDAPLPAERECDGCNRLLRTKLVAQPESDGSGEDWPDEVWLTIAKHCTIPGQNWWSAAPNDPHARMRRYVPAPTQQPIHTEPRYSREEKGDADAPASPSKD